MCIYTLCRCEDDAELMQPPCPTNDTSKPSPFFMHALQRVATVLENNAAPPVDWPSREGRSHLGPSGPLSK